MKKKIKVAYLIDKRNNWLEQYIRKFQLLQKNKKQISKIFKDYKKVKNYDIVFILNYTIIIKNHYLKKNKLNLVIHASNLPKGKGFAPVQWQILDNKNKINVCLFEATSKFDSGNIYEEGRILLNGTELYDEIRKVQAVAIFKIIRRFLRKYPNVSSKKQKGKSTFFRRRTKKDSELNINMKLKKLINQLRIGNNNAWPSFFIYKKRKYIIKIFKENA